jgi:hypothetical protein
MVQQIGFPGTFSSSITSEMFPSVSSSFENLPSIDTGAAIKDKCHNTQGVKAGVKVELLFQVMQEFEDRHCPGPPGCVLHSCSHERDNALFARIFCIALKGGAVPLRKICVNCARIGMQTKFDSGMGPSKCHSGFVAPSKAMWQNKFSLGVVKWALKHIDLLSLQ